MDSLISIVSYLGITAVASERLVEIIKKAWIGKYITNGSVYQLISAAFGAIVAIYNPPEFTAGYNPIFIPIIVGLAISGGSSFWHDILNLSAQFKKDMFVK